MNPQPPQGRPTGPGHPPAPGPYPPTGHAPPPRGYPPPLGYPPPDYAPPPGYAPVSPPQAGPQVGHGPPGGWPNGGQPAPRRPRRKRTVIVAAAAVVLLGIVGVPVVMDALEPAGTKDLGSGSVTDPMRWWVNVPAGDVNEYSIDVPGLALGPSVDDAALAGVDPRQLYWAMLARQGTRQVTDMVIRGWSTPEEYQDEFPANVTTSHVGIDWRTRAFVDELFGVAEDGNPDRDDSVMRCLGNDQYATYYPADDVFGTPARWDVKSTSGPGGWKTCAGRMKPDKVVANANTGDSIAPAGLSPEQMNAFISYLDGVPGLIEVSPPTSVRGRDGKQYIQLDVSLNPQDPRWEIGARMGAAFLNAAFAQTGNNPHDYPYSIDSNEGQGRVMRYFVDPQTLLPAYAVNSDTSPLGLDGTPIGTVPNRYRVYQYSWPDELDPAAMRAEGTPDIPLRPWPFEKIVF
jgi:hypothetical protein